MCRKQLKLGREEKSTHHTSFKHRSKTEYDMEQIVHVSASRRSYFNGFIMIKAKAEVVVHVDLLKSLDYALNIIRYACTADDGFHYHGDSIVYIVL